MLQLVVEGELELDTSVAHYWPEFTTADKATVSVCRLLCHRADLPTLCEQVLPETLCD